MLSSVRQEPYTTLEEDFIATKCISFNGWTQ
jgi:hypothetical protein